MRRDELVAAGPTAWRDRLDRGGPVDVAGLPGAWLGISLGLPMLVERLTWTTFVKTFVADEGGLRGYNVRLRQTGVDGPVEPLRTRHGVRSFGPFAVVVEADRVVLDYGVPGAWPPMSWLRDPVVQVDDGLLLGWSYLHVAGRRIGTPSWFVLERAALPAD